MWRGTLEIKTVARLHADAFGGLENLALGWAHEFGIVLGRLEERKNIGAIVARDAPQGANGSAHLATFESAQKTDGNSRGAGNLCEGKIAALAKAAKTQAGRGGIFGWR